MHTKIYTGWLTDTYGEGDSLALAGLYYSLVETIEDDIEEHGNFLTVRYFVANEKCDLNTATLEWQKTVMGLGNANFVEHYSEITGYLWTDEDLMVGGHDLANELYNFVGKWIVLEIKYQKEM